MGRDKRHYAKTRERMARLYAMLFTQQQQQQRNADGIRVYNVRTGQALCNATHLLSRVPEGDANGVRFRSPYPQLCAGERSASDGEKYTTAEIRYMIESASAGERSAAYNTTP